MQSHVLVSSFAFGWMLLFVPLALLSTIVFYRRRNIQPIQARSPQIMVFANLVFIVFTVTLCTQRIYDYTYPCIINVWQGYIGIISIGNIYLIRSWKLFCHFYLTQQQLEREGDDDVVNTVKKYLSNRFILYRVALVSIPLFAFPLFISQTPEIRDHIGPGCPRGLSDFVLALYTAGYITVFGLVAFKLNIVSDAFGIKEELKAVGIGGALAMPIWLVFNTVEFMQPINDAFPISTISLLIATVWALYCGTIYPIYRTYQKPRRLSITTPGQLDDVDNILKSPKGLESFRNFCAMEFAAENVLFWEAIELLHSMAHQAIHPTRRSIFMDKKPSSQEMLENIKKRVKIIYSKFIEPNAPLEINLPSDIYQEIQNKIELLSNETVTRFDTDALVTHSLSFMSISKMSRQDSSKHNLRFEVEKLSTIFDRAQSEIIDLLNNDTFNRFVIFPAESPHERFYITTLEDDKRLMNNKERSILIIFGISASLLLISECMRG